MVPAPWRRDGPVNDQAGTVRDGFFHRPLACLSDHLRHRDRAFGGDGGADTLTSRCRRLARVERLGSASNFVRIPPHKAWVIEFVAIPPIPPGPLVK
jgi:hypothetical protein